MGGLAIERDLPYDIVSFLGQNVLAASSIGKDKPALQLLRQHSDLHFVGINLQSTVFYFRNESLEFKLDQPSNVLKYYPQRDGWADPGMMHMIKQIMRYFEQYFNWEVDSVESTPPEDVHENASYGR